MSSVTRSEFGSWFDGRGFDVRKLPAEATELLADRGLPRQMLLQIAGPDGIIAGRAEGERLWQLLEDHFDRDGNRRTIDPAALTARLSLPEPLQPGMVLGQRLAPVREQDLEVQVTPAAGGIDPTRGLRLSDIDWTTAQIKPRVGVSQPSAEALRTASIAYANAEAHGWVKRPVMTVIDFSLPSGQPRLWVIDMRTRELYAQHYVSHGEGSSTDDDFRRATRFSDRNGSHMSSLGLYTTKTTYHGNFGESLVLAGREPGINGSAEQRRVVMHPFTPVSEDFVETFNASGMSWGCPGLDPAVAHDIIQKTKGGSALFIYYPDPDYLGRSRLVR